MALKSAVFGMQCFWGESAFAKIEGVLKTRVGYAGGTTKDPTYKSIGDHTEVTELVFDEKKVPYDTLVRYFFKHHESTAAYPTQYRSVILYVDDEQKATATNVLCEVKQKSPGVKTQVEPLKKFYQAEDYHQKYWLRCQSRIHNELGLSDKEIVSSTLAAKVNAFLAGYDRFDVLQSLAAEYKLSDGVVKKIEGIARAGGDPRACH